MGADDIAGRKRFLLTAEEIRQWCQYPFLNRGEFPNQNGQKAPFAD
jgi:hypothetical protein